MSGLTLWFLAGAGLSVVHFLLLIGLVSNLDPVLSKRHLSRRLRRSYAVRYLSLMLLLTPAIRQSTGAGIAAAIGFGLVRLIGAIYLGKSGGIDWSRSH